MIRRYHIPIAALSIVLQVMDVCAAVVGHQHAGESVALAKSVHAGHDDYAHDAHEHGRSLPGHSHFPTDDDCSLCRHAKQAAAPATPALELGHSELVESVVVRLSRRVAVAVTSIHEARGPPALVV